MNLNELTLDAAITGLKNKEFSSADLTQACLNQIQKTDHKLNAYLTMNDTAIAEAKRADSIIASNGDAFSEQPLLGIPFALKDNFLTQGLRTTASSKVLDKYLPIYDATVVSKLRSAGSVILGKTNMDAWAHGSSTETSDYGATKNPWNIEHLPGGSSGGSAAAVAADQCIFAIGSETAGSIRQPASWCGVTGFKPTYGRVSRYGVVSMASSTDSPGPLAKTVEDTALITQIIAGHDNKDATSSRLPVAIDLSRIKASKDLEGKRIALPPEYLIEEMDKEVISCIREASEVLRNLGAIVEEVALLDPHYSIGVYTVVQRSEVSSNLSRYDGVRYGNTRESFGTEAKRRIMLGTFSLSSGYYDEYYNKAQKVRTLIIEDFAKVFKDYDAIIGPVSPTPALRIGASGDQGMFGELQDVLVEASSIAGLTGLSVPCGFVNNLPVGLQITGKQFDEQLILEIGAAYQHATDWHLKRPKITTV